MEHLLNNTNLLHILLVGVGVVRVHNAGRILQISLCIELVEQLQILVMVVGQALVMFIDSAAQNAVSQRISLCLYLPASVDKLVAVLGSVNCVEHNGESAAGGVFHAHGHVNAAGYKAVLLILYRAGAYGDVGHNVGKIR